MISVYVQCTLNEVYQVYHLFCMYKTVLPLIDNLTAPVCNKQISSQHSSGRRMLCALTRQNACIRTAILHCTSLALRGNLHRLQELYFHTQPPECRYFLCQQSVILGFRTDLKCVQMHSILKKFMMITVWQLCKESFSTHSATPNHLSSHTGYFWISCCLRAVILVQYKNTDVYFSKVWLLQLFEMHLNVSNF